MKEWLGKIKSLKKDPIMILLLAGVLLLVISLPSETQPQPEILPQTREKETEAVTEDPFGVAELENRLKRILAQVDGIGRAEVMLTLKSGGKNIVEKDLEQSRGEEVGGNEGNSGNSSEIKSNESTVYQKDSYGNETPYIMEKLAPEIDGVLVIAQGAGNASITNEITEAVMALFNVPAHKIKVMKMK